MVDTQNQFSLAKFQDSIGVVTTRSMNLWGKNKQARSKPRADRGARVSGLDLETKIFSFSGQGRSFFLTSLFIELIDPSTRIRLILCENALRLGRLLTELAPREPEVGLVALVEIQASRTRARVNASGEPILIYRVGRFSVSGRGDLPEEAMMGSPKATRPYGDPPMRPSLHVHSSFRDSSRTPIA